jgi:hypothetical protein
MILVERVGVGAGGRVEVADVLGGGDVVLESQTLVAVVKVKSEEGPEDFEKGERSGGGRAEERRKVSGTNGLEREQ